MNKLLAVILLALTSHQLTAMAPAEPGTATMPAELFKIYFKNESDVPVIIGLLPFGKNTRTEYPLSGSKNPGTESVFYAIKDLVGGHYHLTVERKFTLPGIMRTSHRILAKPEDQDDKASATDDKYKLFWPFNLNTDVVVTLVPKEDAPRRLVATLYKVKTRLEQEKMNKGDFTNSK